MQTKADLQVEVNRLSLQNGILEKFMHDMLMGRGADATTKESMTIRKEKVTVEGWLYRAKSPDGGYIVFKQTSGTDSVNTWAQLVDDAGQICQNVSEYTLPLRIVVQRLTSKRNQIAGY